MTDIMIDLETMSNTHTAAIVQIGACSFNRDTGNIIDEICYNVDLESSMKAGLTVNASTIMWWLSQKKAAINSIIKEPRYGIYNVLGWTNDFLKDAKYIWSHATFDFVILTNAMVQINMEPSFSYKTARDIRTLVDLSGIDISKRKRVGTHHNALDDCRFQVGYTVECLNKLKGK